MDEKGRCIMSELRATGIVRRLDDLGRVLVPKEMRRLLRLREGDALEIYATRSGKIILEKYPYDNEAEDLRAVPTNHLVKELQQRANVAVKKLEDGDEYTTEFLFGDRVFDGPMTILLVHEGEGQPNE